MGAAEGAIQDNNLSFGILFLNQPIAETITSW